MKRTHILKNLVVTWYAVGAIVSAFAFGNVFSIDSRYSSDFNAGAAWAGLFGWLIGNIPLVAIASMLNTQVTNLMVAYQALSDSIERVAPASGNDDDAEGVSRPPQEGPRFSVAADPNDPDPEGRNPY